MQTYINQGVITVTDTWISKCPLIHYSIIEFYYPDRVFRQFGMRQPIPPSVLPMHKRLHNKNRRGRYNHNWAETHTDFVQFWDTRIQHIVSAPFIGEGEPEVDIGYMEWYQKITRRLITPGIGVRVGSQPTPNASIETLVC